MSGLLAGKIALVTGGGTGLGAAIVRRFTQEGAAVVISGRRREPIEALAAEVSGLAVAADVSVEADVVAMVGECISAHGRLDVLVNNAGLGDPGSTRPEDMDIDAFDRLFAVNVRGTMLCAKHAMPALRASRGTMVNMSSMTAIQPFSSRVTAYAASKAAVLSLTKSFAVSGGPDGVRVNAICPGAVDGGIYAIGAARRAAAAGTDRDAEYRATANLSALKRITTVEEVASSTLYLASDLSAGVTGIGLVIDGGRAYAP